MQVIKRKKSSCKLPHEILTLFQASPENNIDTYKSCVLMLRGLQLRVLSKEKKTFFFTFKWINNNVTNIQVTKVDLVYIRS